MNHTGYTETPLERQEKRRTLQFGEQQKKEPQTKKEQDRNLTPGHSSTLVLQGFASPSFPGDFNPCGMLPTNVLPCLKAAGVPDFLTKLSLCEEWNFKTLENRSHYLRHLPPVFVLLPFHGASRERLLRGEAPPWGIGVECEGTNTYPRNQNSDF